MTTVTKSDHTERLGISEVQRICARASQIFREVNLRDVGIDAFVEIDLDGAATGILIGMQVKSGDSFVEANGTRFRMPTDRSHLLYWSGCSFPVIGVVHEPSSCRTAWIDITRECTEDRITSGPFTLTVEYNAETALTPDTLRELVIPTALDHIDSAPHREAVRERLLRCTERWRRSLPSAQTPSSPEERRAAWDQLVEFLLSPTAALHDVADAAHRLSYYMPPDDDKREYILDAALAGCTDHQLRRLVGAADVALDVDSYFAHSVAEVIARVPQARTRLEALLRGREIPPLHRETAVQIIEMIEEEPRDDLREEDAV